MFSLFLRPNNLFYRSPCGFEGHDFTLCCEISGTTTTTTTTTSTTTTTTTTTPQTTEEFPCGLAPFAAPRNDRVRLSVRKRAPLKIVGGSSSTSGAWPWAALIGKTYSNGHFQVICGATLINSNTVISAAHCFEPVSGLAAPDTVRLGEFT